jgi:hypothetical protein
MKIVTLVLLVIALSLPVIMEGCSLFQPGAAIAPTTAPTSPAQIVQKTISCMSASVVPCMTQPPPLNNPQYCMAMAGVACAQAN